MSLVPTTTTLCLDFDPLSRQIVFLLTPKISAMQRTSSSLASPSLGGAAMAIPMYYQLSQMTLLDLLLGLASRVSRRPSGEGIMQLGADDQVFSYFLYYFLWFFPFIKDYKLDRIRQESSDYNNLNYQKTPTRMKKSTLQRHPLDFKIDAFQRSPLTELKIYQKDREEGLRKISRQRFLGRQPSLPYLNCGAAKHNQENINNNYDEVQLKTNQNTLQKVFHRNRCFFKAKTTHVEFTTPKLLTQKKGHSPLDQILPHHSILPKQFTPSKQLLVRSKHTRSSRQCMSAQLQLQKDGLKGQVPAKLRQLRRVLHRKKSSQDLKEVKENRQIGLVVQAQRLAYEGRRSLGQESDGGKKVGFALQDFLNQWRQINLA